MLNKNQYYVSNDDLLFVLKNAELNAKDFTVEKRMLEVQKQFVELLSNINLSRIFLPFGTQSKPVTESLMSAIYDDKPWITDQVNLARLLSWTLHLACFNYMSTQELCSPDMRDHLDHINFPHKISSNIGTRGFDKICDTWGLKLNDSGRTITGCFSHYVKYDFYLEKMAWHVQPEAVSKYGDIFGMTNASDDLPWSFIRCLCLEPFNKKNPYSCAWVYHLHKNGHGAELDKFLMQWEDLMPRQFETTEYRLWGAHDSITNKHVKEEIREIITKIAKRVTSPYSQHQRRKNTHTRTYHSDFGYDYSEDWDFSYKKEEIPGKDRVISLSSSPAEKDLAEASQILPEDKIGAILRKAGLQWLR